MADILKACVDVLNCPVPAGKAHRVADVWAGWQNGKLSLSNNKTPPPDRPARPALPELTSPKNLPRRRLGSIQGRQALLHAVAHIELNAIDLAIDMVCRFTPVIDAEDQHEFIHDWLSVAADEGRHFLAVQDRLAALGTHYGAFLAHDGLWEAATNTADEVLARLSVAPLVLEARGLDVTPQMIANLHKVGDVESAEVLTLIYNEEIGHVATGAKWLKRLCLKAGQDPNTCFQHYVMSRFNGSLKPPFNHEARQKAGLDKKLYENLTR